jgi:hypothetical protein
VKRAEWERFRQEVGAAADPEAFLRQEKGYLPRITAGARFVAEVGEHVLLEHNP